MGGLGSLGLSGDKLSKLLPSALESVIEALGKLPGVGVRTAEKVRLLFA
jgi:3-methyladenine DNA glycosylase/8-oxoguanine DNA glycosylase